MQQQVIRNMQRKLQKQGYDPGTTNGKMGPHTRSTLKRYQTDHGLPATGEINVKTLETINYAQRSERDNIRSRAQQ
jgi:peptidoglycan hydrolase-like protein with peptidoglycan-binding domain